MKTQTSYIKAKPRTKKVNTRRSGRTEYLLDWRTKRIPGSVHTKTGFFRFRFVAFGYTLLAYVQ